MQGRKGVTVRRRFLLCVQLILLFAKAPITTSTETVLVGNCPAPFIESPLIANDRAPFLLVLLITGRRDKIGIFLYFIWRESFPPKNKSGKDAKKLLKKKIAQAGRLNRMGSLAHRLQQRELTGTGRAATWAAAGGRVLTKGGMGGWFPAGWVPQRLRVPLAGLMDDKRILERGCVLLTFLPDANHLRTAACPHFSLLWKAAS
jgi:hypothetical protein